MTALILINTIAALIAVGGLYAVTRFGYLAGRGRFDRRPVRLELLRRAAERPSTERRAA